MAYNSYEDFSQPYRRRSTFFRSGREPSRYENGYYDEPNSLLRPSRLYYPLEYGSHRRRPARDDGDHPPPRPLMARAREYSQNHPVSYETFMPRALRQRRTVRPAEAAVEPRIQAQPAASAAVPFAATFEAPPETEFYAESLPPFEEERHDVSRANWARASDHEWQETTQVRPEGRSRVNVPDGDPGIFNTYFVSDNEQGNRYRPASPDSDDMDAFDEFEFKLAPAESSSKEGDLSELESPNPETDSANVGDNGNPIASKATTVFSAHYTGNAEQGGLHNANLTVLPNPQGQKRGLFRWLHINQEVMNFDAFWVELSRQVHLSDVETKAVAKLRADVKRQSIKSRTNPKGVKVGYMEPRYTQIPLWPKDKASTEASSSTEFARWICLPYFSLQQYSGLLSASNTASFPAQTLLQSEYSRSPQQRDMEQAVCQLGTASRGECFHISQLWCLVLDNTLLVTCGSMSQADLRGDALTITPEPSRPLAGPTGPGRILVSYSDSVVWSLMTDQCLSWFAFMSHFRRFWPQNLEFQKAGQVINASNWPKVLKMALMPRAQVILTVKTTSKPDAPPRGVMQIDSRDDISMKGKAEKTQNLPKFLHVLTLACSNAHQHTDKAGASALHDLTVQLDAAESFLSEKQSYAFKKAFKACKECSRADVIAHMNLIAGEMETVDNDDLRRSYDDRVDIFNAADIVYRLFLPSDYAAPIVERFWGCIMTISQMPEFNVGSPNPAQLGDTGLLRNSLRAMSQDVLAFQNIMSYAQDTERSKIDMPRQFVTAWLHVVSAIVCFTTSNGDWYNHISKGRSLIGQGMFQVIQSISDENLLDKAEVLPLDLFSIMALRLLQDQVAKHDDVAETYSDFLSSLDTDIKTKPSDRSYQRRIDLVQQEMGAVRKNLMRQRFIISCIMNNTSLPDGIDLRRNDEGWRKRKAREYVYEVDGPTVYETAAYSGQQHAPQVRMTAQDDGMPRDDVIVEIESASELSPIDPSGFRKLLLTDCARIIEQREFDFRRHKEYAEDLERTVAFKMSWTKDRQENAIYAFTIVTVVFLPLSSIASIFGMNTNDVRDMDFGQWLYWATAVPVTLLIIVLGLWWMNELGNFVGWAVGKRPSRFTAGYTNMMTPQEQLRTYVSGMVPVSKGNDGLGPQPIAAIPDTRPSSPPAYYENIASVMPRNRRRQEGRQVRRY